MIGAIQGFAQRHRRGLMITAGITGGIYMMGKYAKSKLIEFQEKSAQERTAKENMKRRFEQNQQDCVFTVLSLLPTLGDQLLHELNVELITAKLQQSRSQRPTPAPTPESSMILPAKKADDAEVTKDSTETTTEQSTKQPNGTSPESTVDAHQNEATLSKEDTDEKQQPNGAEATSPSTSSSSSDEEAEVDKNKDEQTNGHISGTTTEEPTDAAEKREVSTEETEEKDRNADDKATTDGSIEPTPVIKVHEEENAQQQQQQQQQQEPTPVTTPEAEQPPVLDRRTKLELWNELKIMSFTRTLTALYSLTFLTLLTQLQLNLLGRFTYVSSVVALSNTDPSIRIESTTKGSMSSTNGILDFQTEKKYLTFSYWLLHEGWRKWNERVHRVVQAVVGSMSLKQQLKAKEFSELLADIRERLEYEKQEGSDEMKPVNMREYLLPDDAADEREVLRAGGLDEIDVVVDDPVLRNLLDETRDFIDSEDFTTVLDKTLTTAFARLQLALQPTFNPFLLAEPRSAIEEIEDEEDVDRSVPLATLLPLVARQVHLIIHGVPNEYVDSLSRVKELQIFSAIVYSSFSEQLNH
ncbi:peroxin [Actinomortierella wolfii]|nr:peroxin [Actinomortierella wolfii]